MNQPGDPRLLADMARRFAARLVNDPTALAWTFARYKAAEGVDDAEVARRLGIDPDLLARVAICGRPRPGLWREDIEAVADRFGIEHGRLIRLVRHVDAVTSFYQAAGADAGLLAAARDRVAEEESTYDGSEPEASVADEGDGGEDEGSSGDSR